MNKWLKILIGLILVVVPIVVVWPGMYLSSWGVAALELLKGGIVWGVILAGLLFLMLGISELKE